MKNKDIQVHRNAARYAMLPVWMLATKWNNQTFLFAMNGQTGKLVGDLPMDKGKYWTYFGTIGGVLMALLMLYNFVLAEMPMEGLLFPLVCILLPLVIAFIVCSILKAQLKSVGKQKAQRYITGSGLQLTVQQDRFVRTTTQTRTINEQKK